jgi:hypothetical protein
MASHRAAPEASKASVRISEQKAFLLVGGTFTLDLPTGHKVYIYAALLFASAERAGN